MRIRISLFLAIILLTTFRSSAVALPAADISQANNEFAFDFAKESSNIIKIKLNIIKKFRFPDFHTDAFLFPLQTLEIHGWLLSDFHANFDGFVWKF